MTNDSQTKNKEEIYSLFFVFIIFIAIFFGVKHLWGLSDLPGPTDLIEISKVYFEQYGLVIFFFTALFESLLVIGNYFPGTLILLFGLSTLLDSPDKVISSYVYISLGMMLGYTINYFLGKYGWHKVIEKMGYKDELLKIENKLNTTGLFSVFFLYLLPGFGSLLSTSFGILRFNFAKFFAFTIAMVLFWNAVWALAVYLFGQSVLDMFNSGYLAVILAGAYLIYLYKSGKLQQMSEPQKN
jgi:membrane protein DedA with SNARE-associated domain